MINRINNSPYLVVMLDETCDISVEKKLAIYIRFIENGQATVAFLGNKHITDSKASGIKDALVEFLSIYAQKILKRSLGWAQMVRQS